MRTVSFQEPRIARAYGKVGRALGLRAVVLSGAAAGFVAIFATAGLGGTSAILYKPTTWSIRRSFSGERVLVLSRAGAGYIKLAVMREHHRTTREAEEFEYVEDEELADYLGDLAPQIGWVVIFFNSLEDTVAMCLRELMLHDPDQDERLDVFLAEMLFAAKSRALMHLYGQTIVNCALKITPQELTAIEDLLVECGKRRNEYAHAQWLGLKQGQVVKVKSRSQKRGIVHRYKRFNVDDVEEDVSFIDAARDTVYEFHERLLDQLYGRT